MDATECADAPETKGGRGASFSPEEDLALARAWTQTSESVVDMSHEAFWHQVSDVYASQPEAVTPRTEHSLRSRWTPLQRTAQKYLAAASLYRSSIPSGEVEEDTMRNIMELYRKNNMVKGKNGSRPAPVFKSVAAATMLSKSPKFGARFGGSSTSCAGYRPGPSNPGSVESTAADATASGVTTGGAADQAQGPAGVSASQTTPAPTSEIEQDSPAAGPGRLSKTSSKRPLGVKRQRTWEGRDGQSAAAVGSLAQSMSAVGTALSASTDRKAALAGLAIETNLVRMLPDGAEKERLVHKLLERARQVNESTSAQEDGTTQQAGAAERSDGNEEASTTTQGAGGQEKRARSGV